MGDRWYGARFNHAVSFLRMVRTRDAHVPTPGPCTAFRTARRCSRFMPCQEGLISQELSEPRFRPPCIRASIALVGHVADGANECCRIGRTAPVRQGRIDLESRTP